MDKINLAIFASGSGSNAENIALHFRNHDKISVQLILTNNPDAYVLERADKLGINAHTFSRDQFYHSDTVLKQLQKQHIHFIVLAGFLWLIPENLIRAYPNRIVNIHPALLPAYGGKGMYGDKVHTAVFQNKEKETGISIHFVDKNYDEGHIIFQTGCAINEKDTPGTIAEKVHALEYEHYPKVIEQIISDTF